MSLPPKNVVISKRAINEIYLDALSCNKRYQIYYGGSSSGKSYQMMLYALLWAMEGRNILWCRQTLTSITDSSWAEAEAIISAYDLDDFFKLNKTTKKITCINGNGGIIIFKGLEKVERIKSIRGKRAIDTVIVDEATEILEATYNQLLLRQRGLTKFKKRIILLFNPVNIDHWIYERFFAKMIDGGLWDGRSYTGADIHILKTTYRDNKFLAEDDLKVFEDLEEQSPYHFQVYANGEFGTLGDKIFTNFEIKEFEPNRSIQFHCGSDLGYSDPCTFAVTQIDERQKTIFVVDETGGVGLLPNSFSEKIKGTLANNNLPANQLIRMDDNEPRFMEQLKALGINAVKAKKQGVLASYLWLMQYKIVIHPRCKNTIQAFKNSEWQKDKATGRNSDEPVHQYTHYIDDIRYALQPFWSASGKIVGSKSSLY